MRGVAKSYGTKKVFDGVNFTLNRGDRVALVGVNGAGKSTMIKLLAGAEPVTAGEFRLGHNVEPDYFAQDQYKALDPNARLLDDLSSVAPVTDSHQTRLRTVLGSFLFTDDDVYKRIGVLSGGERNRYALARMLLRPANLLLLDEPTNHLDLQAKDVLLGALQKFTGTIVFVSHDRYFIDHLATRIFEIENGVFQDYPGNYEDYRWQKDRAGAAETASGITAHGGASRNGERDARTVSAPAKKVNPILVRKMERRREKLEEEIARCEAEIAGCEREMATFKSAEESIRLASLVEERRAQHKELMREWEETAASLEATRD
jgi:ATP-binding cassette subfamily F protein 3